MRDYYSKIFLPASILTGTIIGAGIFSLPFIFKSTGLATSFFYLFLFAVIFIVVYFIYADLIIRTPGEHRFVGYAELYLGKKGFWAALIIGLVQLLFVLVIYLILAPSFFNLIVGSSHYYLLLFWLIGSIVILFNTKRIALIEFFIVFGIIAIIILTFLMGIKNFIFLSPNWGIIDLSKFFFAGPIIFALSGVLSVPEVATYFKESKTPISFLKPALSLAGIVSAIIYGMFVIGILGLSSAVSEDSVSGLIGNIPPVLLGIVGIFGLLSLMSSYILVGVNVRKILEYDLNFSGWVSRVVVIISPILLYFLGFQSFVEAVSFVGAIFIPLEIILIIFMWFNANKKLAVPPILIGSFIKKTIPLILLIFFAFLFYAIIK